jgi:hypothetical protein
MGASVTVDALEARLLVLEAENRRVSSLNNMLVNQLDHMQQNITALSAQLQLVSGGKFAYRVEKFIQIRTLHTD